MSEMSIKQEAKEFLIYHKIEDEYDAAKQIIYNNMFTGPIERVFAWNERDYQGFGFVVYKFRDNYLFSSFEFGSCSGCREEYDATPLECFSELIVSQELSMDMLYLAFSKDIDFLNPDLVSEFRVFLDS